MTLICIHRSTDFLISPDFVEELKMRFAEAKMVVDVKINDLQMAINNENPNITSSEDELDNRFSTYLKIYFIS